MMQSNIFELIDLLVKMSGSKSNLDELKADLDDTESRILRVQKKLDNFEEEMNDDKYFDASSEIVDRNIKISLIKKIQKLNKVKNDISKDLDNAKSDEVKMHDELEDIRSLISSANDYNEVINKSETSSESFNNMITSENKRITHLVEKKNQIEEKYSSIQKKVEYLADSLNEINDKIAKENDRLDEINANLSNVKAYIDVDAKEKDENKYIDIKNQLEKLITHKNDILNDAVYIAGNIKELIADEKKDDIEEEFNRLVDTVSSIPYMELENEDIESEKEKLSEELKNYDSEISRKEYQTMDKEFIEERISYLKDSISKDNEEIKQIESKINLINNDNDVLSSKVFKSEEQIVKIDNSLIDYESYNYDEETEIPKSVVQASNNKLIEEKENISSIAEKYRLDIINNIKELKTANERIEFLNEDIKNKEEELDELEKKVALNTKSSNILEEEKDKIKLEKINKSILDLKNREEFNKSISSIISEFEMLLSSLEFVDKKTRNKIIYEDSSSSTSKSASEEIVEESNDVEEEINKTIQNDNNDENIEVESNDVVEVQNVEEDVNEPVINEDVNTAFPFIVEDERSESVEEQDDNKLRVVELYDIPSDLSENTDQEYMVNDFQDDDYVDLETAISSMEEK